MKSYSFYFNTSDWLASPAVRMMSKAERGVYIGLLALAWESPVQGTLPASTDKVRRLAEMSLDEWAESGETLLEKFPLSECGTYRYNPRLTVEAAKEQARSDKAKKSADMRWQSERNANASKSDANASKKACLDDAQVKLSKVVGKPTMSDSATPSPDGAGFEIFWDEYGRKEGGKAKMNKQWNALKLLTRQSILSGLIAYKQSKMVNGPQFLPMPQTFLNGRFWEAETYGQAPPPIYQTPNQVPGNWDTVSQGAYTAPMGQGIPHPSSYLKPEFLIN